MVKAVYCWDSSTIFTCQKLLLKSIVEKCAVHTIFFNDSWIHGKGYESFLVRALSLQKSTQKCSDTSFFHTSTTVLHHGDWLGHIAPTSSISLSEADMGSHTVSFFRVASISGDSSAGSTGKAKTTSTT